MLSAITASSVIDLSACQVGRHTNDSGCFIRPFIFYLSSCEISLSQRFEEGLSGMKNLLSSYSAFSCVKNWRILVNRVYDVSTQSPTSSEKTLETPQ